MKWLVVLVVLVPAVASAQPASPISVETKSAVIQPPKLLENCKLRYPRDQYLEGNQGVAIISYVVAADGTTKDVKIAQSTGFGPLDSASLTCIEQQKYQPATQNGLPVEFAQAYQVNWRVDLNTTRGGLVPPGGFVGPSLGSHGVGSGR